MNIEDSIRIFIQEKVKSFVRWDLIRFFHDNPHTRDTVQNIANSTTRDVKQIETELLALVESDILKTEFVSDTKIFFLSSDRKIRKTIDQFMSACHNREFRVHAINFVIQELQKN